MRVLQINKFLKIVGGAETYMFQLSKILQDLGHEVKHWGMYDEDNLVDDFPNLLASNIDFQKQDVLSKLFSAGSIIYSKSNQKLISKVLDEFNPDVIHIHNYNFQLTPSILVEIKKRGIKVAHTIHDSQMVCPYHRLYNFKKDEICTKCVTGSFVNCIKDRCFDGSLIKSTIGALESMFYHQNNYYEKYIDAFISPSVFLASLINNRINKYINVIPNFTEVVISNDYLSDDSEEYYLYYGRISEEKGIKEIVDIFAETNLKLKIIGTGPLVDSLINKISSLNNIEFLGPKYKEQLFDLVYGAKYVVQSSKWYENCPMTIIESFALNVPVIGANHSGFKDLIIDGKTGYLIDFNNIAMAIQRLKEIDEVDVKSFKDNVKNYFEENLSREIHVKKIIEVYNNLLDK